MTYPNVLAKMPPAARLTFFYLYRQSDQDGHIEVTVAEVAQAIARSRQAVILALKQLEAVNLLRVKRRRRGRGNGNFYVLNWAKPRKCKPLKNLQSKKKDNTNLTDRARPVEGLPSPRSRPQAGLRAKSGGSLEPWRDGSPGDRPIDRGSQKLARGGPNSAGDSHGGRSSSSSASGRPGPRIDSRGTYHGLNPEERAEVLRALPDEVELVKGGRYYRWVMEQFRLMTWHGGASRAESDLICDAIGQLIDHRSLGFARRVAVWLQSNIRDLLQELRRAILAGIRAAYRIVTALILWAMRLLKAAVQGVRSAVSAGHKKWAHTYNLNDPRERKEFLRRAREIAEGGGGPCPRCGARIERQLLEIDSGIAFEERGLCRCIYIALDRSLKAREQREGFEEDPEQVYARRMAERGMTAVAGQGPQALSLPTRVALPAALLWGLTGAKSPLAPEPA